MKIEVDSRIMLETPPDVKGFREILLGRVTYVDERDEVGTVRLYVVYAYHPETPELGRYLPCPRDERCFHLSEAQPEPKVLLMDFVMSRRAASKAT